MTEAYTGTGLQTSNYMVDSSAAAAVTGESTTTTQTSSRDFHSSVQTTGTPQADITLEATSPLPRSPSGNNTVTSVITLSSGVQTSGETMSSNITPSGHASVDTTASVPLSESPSVSKNIVTSVPNAETTSTSVRGESSTGAMTESSSHANDVTSLQTTTLATTTTKHIPSSQETTQSVPATDVTKTTGVHVPSITTQSTEASKKTTGQHVTSITTQSTEASKKTTGQHIPSITTQSIETTTKHRTTTKVSTISEWKLSTASSVFHTTTTHRLTTGFISQKSTPMYPTRTAQVTTQNVLTPTTATGGTSDQLKPILIGAGVTGGVVLILVIIFMVVFIRRRQEQRARAKRFGNDEENIQDYQYHSNMTYSVTPAGKPKSPQNGHTISAQNGVDNPKPDNKRLYFANEAYDPEQMDSKATADSDPAKSDFYVKRDKTIPLQDLQASDRRSSLGVATDSYNAMYTHNTFGK